MPKIGEIQNQQILEHDVREAANSLLCRVYSRAPASTSQALCLVPEILTGPGAD